VFAVLLKLQNQATNLLLFFLEVLLLRKNIPSGLMENGLFHVISHQFEHLTLQDLSIALFLTDAISLSLTVLNVSLGVTSLKIPPQSTLSTEHKRSLKLLVPSKVGKMDMFALQAALNHAFTTPQA
jgi:hypothetical protein